MKNVNATLESIFREAKAVLDDEFRSVDLIEYDDGWGLEVRGQPETSFRYTAKTSPSFLSVDAKVEGRVFR